jgi:RHS repeat-associated protein
MILTSLPRSLAVCGILMSTPLCAGETGSSTTSYWYGGFLHPLVVTRDGVNHRLIGKSVVEMIGSQVTRSYLSADRLGSVRMVTDDQGKVVQSLGYDTDYGSTRVQGQSAAASFDGMASFYRFQGQEQEVFPLARLGIDDPSLAQWLDEIQLYHFPWRDYAAGFAAFTETDPVPTEDSLYAALGANPVNITDETGGIAVLLDTDIRAQHLLYEVRSNGGVGLSLEDRRYLWNLLQEVRAGTPDTIAREVTDALPLWRNRYQAAFQEWLEAIELEITQDVLWASPDHQFTQEERDGIRLDAEAIARFAPPDRAVAFALDDLTSYELLDSPEKRASYEEYRKAWLFTHERQIEKLYEEADDDEVMTDLLQGMTTAPGPQAPSTQASAVAAREDSPVQRPQAQEEDEKADIEGIEHHDVKNHDAHGPNSELSDAPE